MCPDRERWTELPCRFRSAHLWWLPTRQYKLIHEANHGNSSTWILSWICFFGVFFTFYHGKSQLFTTWASIFGIFPGIPSYIGIVISHYKDPYEPTSISWFMSRAPVLITDITTKNSLMGLSWGLASAGWVEKCTKWWLNVRESHPPKYPLIQVFWNYYMLVLRLFSLIFWESTGMSCWIIYITSIQVSCLRPVSRWFINKFTNDRYDHFQPDTRTVVKSIFPTTSHYLEDHPS